MHSAGFQVNQSGCYTVFLRILICDDMLAATLGKDMSQPSFIGQTVWLNKLIRIFAGYIYVFFFFFVQIFHVFNVCAMLCCSSTVLIISCPGE